MSRWADEEPSDTEDVFLDLDAPRDLDIPSDIVNEPTAPESIPEPTIVETSGTQPQMPPATVSTPCRPVVPRTTAPFIKKGKTTFKIEKKKKKDKKSKDEEEISPEWEPPSLGPTTVRSPV